jgi:tripartite-type tricarboxylate transporter receptor subunit TctC
MTRIRWAVAMVLLWAVPAFAQDWPARPVKIVVPFAPGGSVDSLARLLGTRLAESLGQQFIVENRPGASGSVGTAFVAKSPPDGYTYVIVSDTHAINPFIIPSLPYDNLNDLASVMLIGTAPMAIATGSAQPYKTFAELAKDARAKRSAVNYATVGVGSLGHLVMAMAQRTGDVTLVHVPYKGVGALVSDVMGNQVTLAIASATALLPYAQSGKLRLIALTGERRLSVIPDVPTLQEQGFNGLSALVSWSVLAPAGTPRPIIDKLNAELRKALNEPQLHKQVTQDLGIDLAASTPEEQRKWTSSEMERWGKVIKDNNIRAQ